MLTEQQANGTVNVQGGELNVNVDRTTGKTYVEAMLVNGGSLKMSSGWISAKTTTGPVSSIYLYGVQSEVTGGLLNVSAVEGDCYGMTLVNTPSGHIAGVQVTAEAQNGDAYGMHMSKTGNLTLDQFHIKVKSDNGVAYGIYNGNGAGCLDIGTQKDAVSIIAVEGKLAVYGVDYHCVAGTYRHQYMKIVCSSYEDIATGLVNIHIQFTALNVHCSVQAGHARKTDSICFYTGCDSSGQQPVAEPKISKGYCLQRQCQQSADESGCKGRHNRFTECILGWF